MASRRGVEGGGLRLRLGEAARGDLIDGGATSGKAVGHLLARTLRVTRRLLWCPSLLQLVDVVEIDVVRHVTGRI